MYKRPLTYTHTFPAPQSLNLARGLTAIISCLCLPGAIINIRKGKQMQPFPLTYLRVCTGLMENQHADFRSILVPCLGDEVKSGDPAWERDI